jgi:predicted RNase H-like nuclease (RuvC/YqgF family)
MRTLIVIFGLFLASCIIVGQQPSEETKKDSEFVELLKKAKQTQEINKVAIQEADKKTGEMITKAANQIVSLKAEVKQLKSELNEANKKLDSIDAPISNVKFDLLPVSSGKENW